MNGRIVTLGLLAAFTAVVLLLLQSTFWSGRVSAPMQVIVLAMTLLSYFRPHYGLLALALLVPLGLVGPLMLESQMRGSEGLVLAFLAGTLVRGWTLREFRTFPSTYLETAALIFGLVVAGSCAEQIWLSQVQSDYPWPFVQTLMTYASRDYISTVRDYSFMFRAMLLLEGTAVLLFCVKFSRGSPDFARQLVTMLIAGAVCPLALMFREVAGDISQGTAAGKGILTVLSQERWSAYVRDVNAAGSFFAMILFIALGMAIAGSRSRAVWAAVGLASAAAVVLTRSRTAILASVLVSGCAMAAWTLGRRIGVQKALGAAVLILLGVAIAAWQFLPREFLGPMASEAVMIRWWFLRTTWGMVLANPLFGVGIGQYPDWSVQFAPPELLNYYQQQNAHNNFAQIAGELGTTGILAFITLLAVALWPRRDVPAVPSTTATPLLAGLAAFILSWLGGHPLLIPEVAFPFWLTLGLVAAGSLATTPRTRQEALVIIVLVALAVSIPLRVHTKAQRVDFSRVRYGLSAKHIMTSRARFFVPAGTERVDVPLRAYRSNDEQPLVVDVLVDDVAGQTVEVTEREWRTAHVVLPRDAGRRFRQIELHVRPSATTEDDERERLSVEVGTWKIISKPNG